MYTEYKHNFNKSMKTYIENELYSLAANYLQNTNATIICGPEALRTHLIARNTGLVQTRTPIYVERNPAIYSSIQRQLSNQHATVVNDDIINLRATNFIDFDVTGAITAQSGTTFASLLKSQHNLLGTKAIIYTFALRPISLNTTLRQLTNLINKELKADINFSVAKLSHSKELRRKWKQETYAPIVHCNQLNSTFNSAIYESKGFYYNSGGGHMLSGILIYE